MLVDHSLMMDSCESGSIHLMRVPPFKLLLSMHLSIMFAPTGFKSTAMSVRILHLTIYFASGSHLKQSSASHWRISVSVLAVASEL